MATETVSQHKPKVTISRELSAQIGFLHSQCPENREWSGLLIYEVIRGSVNDLENLEIKAHAVFPMDFGDATFTSFEASDYWLTAFSRFPQIDPLTPTPGWYLGKIHSHHNMGVFHSATDKTDLHNTAPSLPMFLSLIVNYRCQTDCELAIEIECEEKIITRLKWRLKGWAEKIKENKIDTPASKRVYVLKCIVDYEQEDWFKSQINLLKEKNKPRVYTGSNVYPSTYSSPGYQTPSNIKRDESFYKNKYKGNKKQRKRDKKKNKIIHSSDIGSALDHIKEYTQKTYQIMLREASDLFTLGMGHTLSPADALKHVDQDLSVAERASYQKGFVYYFFELWYPANFAASPTYVDADELEVVKAIKELLTHYGTMWIHGVLTDCLKEIEGQLEAEEDDDTPFTAAEIEQRMADELEAQQIELYH